MNLKENKQLTEDEIQKLISGGLLHNLVNNEVIGKKIKLGDYTFKLVSDTIDEGNGYERRSPVFQIVETKQCFSVPSHKRYSWAQWGYEYEKSDTNVQFVYPHTKTYYDYYSG